MSMIQATHKQFGGKPKPISIKLPEEAYNVLKDYEVDIVEFDMNINKFAMIYVSKDKQDLACAKVNLRLLNSFKEGFKQIFEELEQNKP